MERDCRRESFFFFFLFFFGGGKWFSSEEEKLFSAGHNGRLGQGRSPIVISPFNGAFT